LDPFENIYNEANESFNPKAIRGLVNTHLVKCVVEDLCPNFSYNMFTQRFVKSPIILKPNELEKAPKSPSTSFGFGSVCGKAYENYVKLTYSYFGKPHLESFFQAPGGYFDLPYLLEECLNNIWNKLVDLQVINCFFFSFFFSFFLFFVLFSFSNYVVTSSLIF